MAAHARRPSPGGSDAARRDDAPVHGENSGLNVPGRITLQNGDGERGSCAGRALDSDVAAKELRQVPCNRQPKPRAAVLARGAVFGLAELLEDQL